MSWKQGVGQVGRVIWALQESGNFVLILLCVVLPRASGWFLEQKRGEWVRNLGQKLNYLETLIRFFCVSLEQGSLGLLVAETEGEAVGQGPLEASKSRYSFCCLLFHQRSNNIGFVGKKRGGWVRELVQKLQKSGRLVLLLQCVARQRLLFVAQKKSADVVMKGSGTFRSLEVVSSSCWMFD